MIIPKPLEMEVNSGYFTLKDNFVVYLDPKLDLHHILAFITEHILPPTGYHFQTQTTSQDESQLCFVYDSEIVVNNIFNSLRSFLWTNYVYAATSM